MATGNIEPLPPATYSLNPKPYYLDMTLVFSYLASSPNHYVLGCRFDACFQLPEV